MRKNDYVFASDCVITKGISVRDYIAIQAMCRALTEPQTGQLKGEGWQERLARVSYEIADAMIAESNREGY